jgi:hypothetical protein
MQKRSLNGLASVKPISTCTFYSRCTKTPLSTVGQGQIYNLKKPSKNASKVSLDKTASIINCFTCKNLNNKIFYHMYVQHQIFIPLNFLIL